MPGFDGTGPLGMGPRTGGGFGFCPPGVGYAPYRGRWPVYGVGRGGLPWGGGRGRAWGGGRGRWWGYAAAPAYPYAQPWSWGYRAYSPSQEGEVNFLREQARSLEEELKAVRERLEKLETGSAK